jgi:hypothetical protein
MGWLVKFATSLIAQRNSCSSPPTSSYAHLSFEAVLKLLELIASSLAVTSPREHHPELSLLPVFCGAHQHRRHVYTTASPNRSRYVPPCYRCIMHSLYARENV